MDTRFTTHSPCTKLSDGFRRGRSVTSNFGQNRGEYWGVYGKSVAGSPSGRSDAVRPTRLNCPGVINANRRIL